MELEEVVCWRSGESQQVYVYGVRSSDMYCGTMSFRALNVRRSILCRRYVA